VAPSGSTKNWGLQAKRKARTVVRLMSHHDRGPEMQCSVLVDVELDPSATVEEMERMIFEAGLRAMRQALTEAIGGAEAAHPTCPHCGGNASCSEGTVRRRVLTRFGRVVVGLRRRRCAACGRRFRPAVACFATLGRSAVTAALAEGCVLAGTSWPYATAAQVLRRLSGAQVSAETVRRLCNVRGDQEASRQQAAADQLVAPTAADVRAERAQAALQPFQPPAPCPPARLLVGLDGGWIPSRDQDGGMEGKVAVVATGSIPVGKHGRHRLTPRRYVATFASSEAVGALTYAAAVAVGGDTAPEQLVLGDGADWIKTEADLHFPDAVGILDWAHVARALHKAIRAACPGPNNRDRRRDLHQAIPATLWQGQVDATLRQLQALRPAAPATPVPLLEQAMTYLESQRAWLGDYQTWQARGYPIGSGLIERAVAIVINRRMKRQGMRWRRANATALVTLRVRILNADWDVLDAFSPPAA